MIDHILLIIQPSHRYLPPSPLNALSPTHTSTLLLHYTPPMTPCGTFLFLPDFRPTWQLFFSKWGGLVHFLVFLFSVILISSVSHPFLSVNPFTIDLPLPFVSTNILPFLPLLSPLPQVFILEINGPQASHKAVCLTVTSTVPFQKQKIHNKMPLKYDYTHSPVPRSLGSSSEALLRDT